jgi:uncharacterized protein YndB with AHSA1/START domain
MPARRRVARSVGELCAALVVCAPWASSADVIEKSASAFTVRTTVTVAAPADRLFRALIDVGSWWGKDHTYSGDSTNMSIAAQPGGCFCEQLPDGGGVEHGRVVNLVPGSLLRLDAALGPLQALAVTGRMTWQVAGSGESSTLTMTYVVAGYAPGGLDTLAPIVDQVLAEQVGFLRAYAEKSR